MLCGAAGASCTSAAPSSLGALYDSCSAAGAGARVEVSAIDAIAGAARTADDQAGLQACPLVRYAQEASATQVIEREARALEAGGEPGHWVDEVPQGLPKPSKTLAGNLISLLAIWVLLKLQLIN